MKQPRAVPRWAIRVLAVGALVLVGQTLSEPVFVLHLPHLPPKFLVMLPSGNPPPPMIQAKVPETLHPSLPAAPRLPGLNLGWVRVPGSLPSTLDLVRREVGSDVSPLDFQTPGLRTEFLPSFSSSGSQLDVNLFFHGDDLQVAVDVHNQASAAGYFPGMAVELYEYPLFLSQRPLLVSPRFGFWTDPASWGLVGSLALEIPLEDDLWLWVEGGVRGATDKASVRTGLHWSL